MYVYQLVLEHEKTVAKALCRKHPHLLHLLTHTFPKTHTLRYMIQHFPYAFLPEPEQRKPSQDEAGRN